MYSLYIVFAIIGYVIASTLANLDDDKYDPVPMKDRKTEATIHPLLLSRTSQREMTGEPIPDKDLLAIFEAARWASSAFNIQPWRFVYAKHGTPRFNKFLATFDLINQWWAKNASVLIFQIAPNYEIHSEKVYPVQFKDFDSGSAFMSLSLEASGRGLVAHAIGGLNFTMAYDVLNVTQTSHTVELAIAVGVNVTTHRLMPEMIMARNPVKQFVFENTFVNTDPDQPVGNDYYLYL